MPKKGFGAVPAGASLRNAPSEETEGRTLSAANEPVGAE